MARHLLGTMSGQLQAVVCFALVEVTMKGVTVPSLLLLVAICSVAQQPRFDGKSCWHHVKPVAADNMEGRGPGTPGLQRADPYVVAQPRNSGPPPAGTDGYYQPIELETRQPVENDS